MLAKLKKLLGGNEAAIAPTSSEEETRVATAALMLEAALSDDTYCEAEKQMICDLLVRHYDMNAQEVQTVVSQAEKAHENSDQILYFTRTVKENVPYDDRVHIIEMLWEMAYADGSVSDYEANLIRRVCGLIYVDDVESGRVRKLVEQRQSR
ncbi:TerB family tellurite resistance protein [Sneathiella glossodoripedis]|uniref:tellurite resistance TerB family protein n=1 Tax=Sneathiella glossodoripedis TaxID=418853 RepID=UPI000470AE71|nr:TerB family tellurite resistance protein [Sneathiella glossodoripedis]